MRKLFEGGKRTSSPGSRSVVSIITSSFAILARTPVQCAPQLLPNYLSGDFLTLSLPCFPPCFPAQREDEGGKKDSGGGWNVTRLAKGMVEWSR
ncbi:hypothetical protein D6792_00890 [Candidatus Parcubacteria bacterium]|nr:MAG: hypothetical protein D6792_00890 [Candidatus Parcubacteria bacterium]